VAGLRRAHIDLFVETLGIIDADDDTVVMCAEFERPEVGSELPCPTPARERLLHTGTQISHKHDGSVGLVLCGRTVAHLQHRASPGAYARHSPERPTMP
jgi:hypothetical protein